MSRSLAALGLLVALLPSALMPASLPVPAWFERRLRPETVQVRDVKG